MCFFHFIQVGFAQTAALVVLVQALENMEKLCGLARGGPESATENLENSKQSYEKRVISFVKLACLFCKASARRRSIDLIFFCKVSSSTSDVLFILSLFFNFWRLFWKSWGTFGALLAPRSAQCDSGPNFCALFSTFGALWAPRKCQKEPQGAQRRPKWCPK